MRTDPWSHPLAEAAAWALPLGLGILAFVRAGRRRRASLGIVVAALGTIVLDKLVDLHARLMHLGRGFVNAFDPEHSFRGETLVLRTALLGGIFVVGVLVLLFTVRYDRGMRPAKWVALAGVALVMALLMARLVPGLGALRAGPGKALEACAWLLVLGSTASVARRPGRGGDEDADDWD